MAQTHTYKFNFQGSCRGAVTGKRYYFAKGHEVSAPSGEFVHLPKGHYDIVDGVPRSMPVERRDFVGTNTGVDVMATQTENVSPEPVLDDTPVEAPSVPSDDVSPDASNDVVEDSNDADDPSEDALDTETEPAYSVGKRSGAYYAILEYGTKVESVRGFDAATRRVAELNA